MPRITTVSELTIDGRLALAPAASSKALFGFYDGELRNWFHAQRACHDAIMVGAGTVRTDDPELTVRYAAGDNPLRIVPLNNINIPQDSILLNDGLPTLLAAPAKSFAEVARAFAHRPCVEIMECGEDQVDLLALMDRLDRRGIASLMVEGGSRLLHSFFALDLVSRIIIKHIPIIAGNPDAPGYLRASDGCLPVGMSRWQIEDWRIIGGVGVSTYVRATAQPEVRPS